MKEKITVETFIAESAEHCWKTWVTPEHIEKWNATNDDWHTPKAENDFREGGTFDYRMEAKDGSFGFNLKGEFTHIIKNEAIHYVLEDGRAVELSFQSGTEGTHVKQIFEAETENPIDLQRMGWQAILNNYKNYCEAIASNN